MKTRLKRYTQSISRFLVQVTLILLVAFVLGEVGLRAYNIDLHKYFVKNLTAQYYKSRDTRWNVAGNELAAEAITNYMRSIPTAIGNRRGNSLSDSIAISS